MGIHRKIIRITAEDSPNVRLAREEIARGDKPSHKTVIPGVLTYRKYLNRRRTWDPVKQEVGLDARFWEGKDVLMFPEQWLNLAHEKYEELREGKWRKGHSLGMDPGEGTANTTVIICDQLGFLYINSKQTPDTSDATDMVIDAGHDWQVPSDNWCFDAGGGGKQLKDILVRIGHKGVTVVSFGSAPSQKPKHGMYTVAQRLNFHELRSAYLNMRSQMYYELRCLFDPGFNPQGFALPHPRHGRHWAELRRQLLLIPLWYDQNGKIWLPPKHRKPGLGKRGGGGPPTMTEIIGKSPDEADAAVVCVHRMLHGKFINVASVSTKDSMDRHREATVARRKQEEQVGERIRVPDRRGGRSQTETPQGRPNHPSNKGIEGRYVEREGAKGGPQPQPAQRPTSHEYQAENERIRRLMNPPAETGQAPVEYYDEEGADYYEGDE